MKLGSGLNSCGYIFRIRIRIIYSANAKIKNQNIRNLSAPQALQNNYNKITFKNTNKKWQGKKPSMGLEVWPYSWSPHDSAAWLFGTSRSWSNPASCSAVVTSTHKTTEKGAKFIGIRITVFMFESALLFICLFRWSFHLRELNKLLQSLSIQILVFGYCLWLWIAQTRNLDSALKAMDTNYKYKNLFGTKQWRAADGTKHCEKWLPLWNNVLSKK